MVSIIAARASRIVADEQRLHLTDATYLAETPLLRAYLSASFLLSKALGQKFQKYQGGKYVGLHH